MINPTTTNTMKSAATGTAARLDHSCLASALDEAYHQLVAIDCRLAAAGLSSSWRHPARQASLRVLECMGELRPALDRLAGGPGLATPYVHRKPVAAAPEAPGAGAGAEVPKVLGKGDRDTRDDDREASVVDGMLQGPAAAVAGAGEPRITSPSPPHADDPDALLGAPGRPEVV